MIKVAIKETQNPSILKFEFPDFITTHQNFEYKNIDETASSPLAKQLFYLPFVKTVYIASNFIAIEKFSIVEWHEVQEVVAEQIEQYVDKGGKIILETALETKKNAVTIYGETTPNPAVMKFVANKMLTKIAFECKNIDDTKASPLAKELFQFSYVKEVFIDENYVSVTKYDVADWQEITLELRTFIKKYMEDGKTVVIESELQQTVSHQNQQDAYFDNLDETSQRIINILEEYVKPAVAADGGNIVFQSFDAMQKRVKVILQGACSGCPSSTFTLKSGIENMLKEMLNDRDIVVEAVNG